MQYKIKHIGDEGVDVRVPITPAWLAEACPDLGIKVDAGAVMARGRLDKSGDSYLLRATIAGPLSTNCSRCLEPAAIRLDVPLTISYVEEDERSASADDEDAASDDVDVLPFSGGVIDLAPAIRDEIFLSLPIGPLCKEDCAGICPLCGGNRNTSPCDCVDRQRVSQLKFAALAKVNLKE
jgi:uncharacterized protein